MGVYTSSVTFNDSTTQTTKFDSSNEGGNLLSITSYTTAGSYTWTKPSGCKKVIVRLVGGGGGSSGYCESGGAGGYSEKMIDVTSVATVSVTVGGGGGATGYYTAAPDGGTSSFGAYCSATGGYGANRNYSHTGGLGGVGSGGDINLYGGMGTGHGNSMGHGVLGRGGETYFGGAPGGKREGGGGGNVGQGAPGSGGCGGRTNDNHGSGGPGKPGAVYIWEYT